ncbi:class I SAM-dependent methyltransferase [Desulfovibrio aminophilus]|uniref:class I SAM-dependent methyltransferase n=1 Tax=Desulfovibrio aminophilus TaxID=81425 RepID=UPI00042625EA|nr:class I SAM-dependent methyltransferase [Desulfovibrio aminophilus]
MTKATREPQYRGYVESAETEGLERFGLMSNQVWRHDPKRLVFLLSRYKFVAKMLAGKNRVLELGCADAFGSRIVRAEVGGLVCADFDPVFIEDARRLCAGKWEAECREHDILTGPVVSDAPDGKFDAAYTMDVIEHIEARHARTFMGNLAGSLTPQGVLIVGTPSLESQAYASPASKEGHVNCMSHKPFRALLQDFFHNVFLFSMNDEVVHTGFYPMAHYLIGLCVGPK